MKIQLKLAATLLLLSTLNLQLSTTFAQGSLTPPGPPAPTMKSLDQIEARTPITSLPITITQPGSYYLTSSFDLGAGQDGIFVSALNVTIDLNGFTIRSFDSGNTAVGIRIDPLGGNMANLTIRNGHIAGEVLFSGGIYGGNGFGYGIYCPGNPLNVHIVDVTVSGCRYDGINVGVNSTVVESCSVSTVGGNGIVANAVSRCAAYQCGGYAISAQVAGDSYGSTTGEGGVGVYATTANNCYGVSSGTGYGVFATTALNCYGSCSGGYGVLASTAQNCYGSSAGNGYGVFAGDTASGCNGYSNSGAGLSAFIANVCHGETVSGTALVATHNVNSF